MKFTVASRAIGPNGLAHFGGAGFASMLRLGVLSAAVAAVCLVQVVGNPAVEQPSTAARSPAATEPAPAVAPEKPKSKDISITPASALNPDEIRNSDWFARAGALIGSQDYFVYPRSEGYYGAHHPTQNIRVEFDQNSVQFRDSLRQRTESGEVVDLDRWEMSWSTVGLGRESEVSPIYGATVSGREARVVYDRYGVVEYYDNMADGIEQSFAIKEPPKGSGDVVLRGCFQSDTVDLILNPDERSIDLRSKGGVIAASYKNLACFDADRRILPSRMRVTGNQVDILVNDAGAAYPITIDPVVTSIDCDFSADPTMLSMTFQYGWNNRFGASIAGGDFNNDGVGDMVVGCPGRDANNSSVRDSGAFYVYYGIKDPVSGKSDAFNSGKDATAGTPMLPWCAYEPNSSDFDFAFLGCNMISGDFNNDNIDDLCVSAPNKVYPSGNNGAGAVFIWYGLNGTKWTATASTQSVTQQMGSPNVTFQGNNVFNGNFGLSLCKGNFKSTSSLGNDIAISSRTDTVMPSTNHPGKVFVFYSNAGGGFNSTVAASSANLQIYSTLVGAVGEGMGLGMSDWRTPETNITAYSLADYLKPHQALAAGNIDGVAGDELIVGAFDADSADVLGYLRGGIFIFSGGAGGLSGGASLINNPEAAGSSWRYKHTAQNHRLGSTVACADFNNDGFADVVASAPGAGTSQEGQVYMWKGQAGVGGPVGGMNPATPAWMAESDLNSAGLSNNSLPSTTAPAAKVGFGGCLAVGDFASIGGGPDGVPDLIISAKLSNSSPVGGTCYGWLGVAGAGGSLTGNTGATPNNPGTAYWQPTLDFPVSGSEFGHVVAIGKSIDSDTAPDILVGNPRYTTSEVGRARMFTNPAGFHFAFNTQSLPVNPDEALLGGKFLFPTDMTGKMSNVVSNAAPPNGTKVRFHTYDGSAKSTSTGTPGTPDFTAVTSGYFEFDGTSTSPYRMHNGTDFSGITIIDDGVDESSPETFTIWLEYPDVGRVGFGTSDIRSLNPFTGTSRYCTISIADNDAPPFGRLVVSDTDPTEIDQLQLNESPISGEPGSGTFTWTVWVYIPVVSGQDAQLLWQTSEEFPTPAPPSPYAKNNQDFVASSGVVTITSGPTSQYASFNITFKADLIDEDPEGFTLTMTSTSSCEINGGGGTPPTFRPYPVTIIDDDAPPVACFDLDAYSVIEGNSGQTFFTVTIQLLDPVTGVPRASEKRVEIHYSTEILGAGLSFQPVAAEDPTMVPQYGVSNDFIPIDTTKVFDYNGTSGTVTPPNITSEVIQFYVSGDRIYEVDEEFHLFIDEATSQNCQVAITGMIGAVSAPFDSTVTIVDDERTGNPATSNVPTCQFSVANTNVNETDTDVTITIVMSEKHERWVYDGPTLNGVMVQVDYQANTGSSGCMGGGPVFAPGDDYRRIDPTTMELPWLTLSVTFQVHIYQDTLNEAAESIDLALTNSPPLTGLAMGVITVATITILDDDGSSVPTISFELATTQVSETAINAIINVKLSTASGQAVRITCSTSDGTAQAPGDYTTQSVQITFNPGQTTRNFVVPILDDNIRETTEFISLDLTSPIAGNLGTPSSMTIDILDNEPDPVVQFKRSTYGVSEAGIAATINVTLSIQSALPVTVQYITTEGTAIDGLDYNDVAGTLTFPGGSTEQIFTVPILNDTLIELDETVIMALSNPINASLGTITAATLTIVNDESGGNGGGGGVNKGGGGCAGSETNSAGMAGILAVLAMLVGMRVVRRRKA